MTIQTLSLFVGPLLDQYANADPEHRQDIESEIWQKYGRELVVLVLDMSGFSLLTQRHGIVHYLAMVRRMQRLVAPVVVDHGGAVVKFEADNCFAVFGEAMHAIQAAQAIHAALAAQDHPDKIRVSIGIDSGKVLVVDNLDVFGNAVNRAAKLGEDIAEAGETLVTAETYALVPKDAGITGKPAQIAISGIQIGIISL
ncbi:MAG: adenylate/guanylate cyclase domain-containing protein [Betaproteobacteria bacterium]